jgi:hypothetical protein
MISMRWFTLVLMSVFLFGCSTASRIAGLTTPNYSQLYLVGTFNWWEADALYQVQPLGGKRYHVQVELIADGEPYDFKFSDSHWTPGLNCGAINDQRIAQINQSYQASCTEAKGNFRFTPNTSASYDFIIDFSGDQPKVSVVLSN